MNPAPASSIQSLAQALLAAYRGGAAADDAAFAAVLGSADHAYACQELLLAAIDGAAGTPARHWKCGGPSREAVLTHAGLPAAGVRADGASMQGLHLRERGIEAEIALRLGRSVTAQEAATLTQEQAASCIDAMCVSIEVVDTRWAGGRAAPALLRLADLQSHGALVLGAFVPFEPRDWAQQRCRVRLGAGEWQQFQGTHSLGDPAWLLPTWLRHVTRHGQPVPAGTVVTTGTWCGLLQATPGDRVEVEFPGIGQASCTV